MLIACATDRRYLEMTGVLVRSIAAQEHRTTPEIAVFGFRLKPRDRRKLSACAGDSARLTLIDVEGDTLRSLEALETKRHLSPTVYATLVMPSLLPGRTGRMLYFDSDVVVNAPLDPLYDVDLQGHTLGAVQDLARVERLRNLNEAIGQQRDAPYFNSGVMLIDLDRWRERGIGEAAMDYARRRGRLILQHDQAVLNKVIGSDWAKLDPKWNNNPSRLPAADALAMPIQHFWGMKKPFFEDYPLALRQIYDRHRAMTPWARSRRKTAFERSARSKLREWQGVARDRLDAVLGRFAAPR